jgi:3'-5' exoribonuclease
MTKQYISELAARQHIHSTFMVRDKSTPLGKNGKAYLNLTLTDKTGELEARMWNNIDEVENTFDVFDIVEVDGHMLNYQGRLQLRIDAIAPVERSQIEPFDYLPRSELDPEAMLAEVKALLEGIQDRWIKALLQAFLDDEALVKEFTFAPAAKSIHHSYVHGLLEHTLSLLRLAAVVCPLYPRINRDFVLAGCFLHDLGKCREISTSGAFEYTDEGKLLGHIAIALELTGEKIRGLAGFPSETAVLLKHLILSHHGELKFGSPKRPKTAEALLVSYLDELDSQVDAWFHAVERDPNKRWTSYQKTFDRYLFKGLLGLNGPEAAPPKREKAEQDKLKEGPLTYKPFAALAKEDDE